MAAALTEEAGPILHVSLMRIDVMRVRLDLIARMHHDARPPPFFMKPKVAPTRVRITNARCTPVEATQALDIRVNSTMCAYERLTLMIVRNAELDLCAATVARVVAVLWGLALDSLDVGSLGLITSRVWFGAVNEVANVALEERTDCWHTGTEHSYCHLNLAVLLLRG